VQNDRRFTICEVANKVEIFYGASKPFNWIFRNKVSLIKFIPQLLMQEQKENSLCVAFDFLQNPVTS
jgi:hypothetical protein